MPLNTPNRLTFTQPQIDAMKIVIANKEGRLYEDICDAEVFDYLYDMENMEIQAAVFFLNQQAAKDMNFDEALWQEPRTRWQIAMDMVQHYANPQAWLAYC